MLWPSSNEWRNEPLTSGWAGSWPRNAVQFAKVRRPAVPAQRLHKGQLDVLLHEQREPASHARGDSVAGANVILFGLPSELRVFGERCIDLGLVVVVVGESGMKLAARQGTG